MSTSGSTTGSTGEQQARTRAVGGTGSELRGGKLGRGRARNAPEIDARRLMNGQAWDDFCEALRRAGRIVQAKGAPETELDRAEGYRYLAALAIAGLRHTFELADPERPRFLRNPDSTSKAGAETADNLYLLAQIRPDRTYRITGRRRSAWGFLLEVKEGYMQLGDARNFATFDDQQLQIEPDGSFEIVLSARPPAPPAPRPKNWVPLDPDASQVLIRQYLCDWDQEEPDEFFIAEVESAGTPPEPFTPVQVTRLLDDAGLWVEQTARIWDEWVRELRAAYRPDVVRPAQLFVGGADDIHYGNDYYRLEPDQALIVEIEPPDARYWQIQLVDQWFGSMDYANRQSSLNHVQARLDSDGRARFVIAHRDPGVPNWLDTGGHREGVLQYRYIWSRNAPVPRRITVPLDRVRESLPADTPRVTPEQRRAAIARRQEHVRRRERNC
jgi:hypothetical protein